METRNGVLSLLLVFPGNGCTREIPQWHSHAGYQIVGIHILPRNVFLLGIPS